MTQPPAEVTFPIAEAVSDALELPVENLPPLSDAVDLEAVDALGTADQSEGVTITFRYANLRVLVRSGRTVYVRPIQDDRRDRLATSPR